MSKKNNGRKRPGGAPKIPIIGKDQARIDALTNIGRWLKAPVPHSENPASKEKVEISTLMRLAHLIAWNGKTLQAQAWPDGIEWRNGKRYIGISVWEYAELSGYNGALYGVQELAGINLIPIINELGHRIDEIKKGPPMTPSEWAYIKQRIDNLEEAEQTLYLTQIETLKPEDWEDMRRKIRSAQGSR